jgi:outer membrane protein insertion porin family
MGSLIALVALPLVADDSAESLTIREIRIEGLKYTHEPLVRQQLTCEVGEPYSQTAASKDRERLDRLGVFSDITITAEVHGDEVVVLIVVAETPRFLPFPSLSFSGENGMAGGPGVKATNLMGRAISLQADLRFGGQQELQVKLDSPWGLRDKAWYGLKVQKRQRINELNDSEEHALEGEFSGGYQIGSSLRVGGRFEFLTLESAVPDASLAEGNNESTPGISAVVAYDTLDLRTDPWRGWQNTVTATRFGGLLGGAGDFDRVSFDIRRYQPLKGRHTFVFFSYTTLQSGEVGVDIPISREFHLGGTNTVRGWSELGGPHGKNQFFNSLEYRYDLVKTQTFRVFGANLYGGLKLAVFGDVGTAWNRGSEFRSNVIGGFGIGIRVIAPFLEMIRFDLAIGETGNGVSPHFGLAEKAASHANRVR